MRSRFLPYGSYFNIVLFLMVVVLSSAGMYIFRDVLLRNARSTGMTLASNYAAEERNKLAVYETLLAFGAASIDIRLMEGNDEYMAQYMSTFLDRLQTVFGRNMITPYVILNDRILTSDGRLSPLKDSRLEESAWYRTAMEKPGETIFTGMYENKDTGASVITAARRCRVSEAVIVFDIFSHNFHFELLPEYHETRDSFFLCDADGNMLYKHTRQHASEAAVRGYVNLILEKNPQRRL